MGAESVNLIAGEKPADVYSGIAMRHVPIFSTWDPQREIYATSEFTN